MPTRDLDYRCDDVNLRGYLAWNDSAAGPRPGVLVFHEGLGLGEFAMERARRLAGPGYVGLAARLVGLCRAGRRHVWGAAAGHQPAGDRTAGRRPARRAGKTPQPRPRRA